MPPRISAANAEKKVLEARGKLEEAIAAEASAAETAATETATNIDKARAKKYAEKVTDLRKKLGFLESEARKAGGHEESIKSQAAASYMTEEEMNAARKAGEARSAAAAAASAAAAEAEREAAEKRFKNARRTERHNLKVMAIAEATGREKAAIRSQRNAASKKAAVGFRGKRKTRKLRR